LEDIKQDISNKFEAACRDFSPDEKKEYIVILEKLIETKNKEL
jgi:hypothetical protein